MEPKFVDFPGASVIGMGNAYTPDVAPREIPTLWKHFADYCKQHSLPLQQSFGVCMEQHPDIPKRSDDQFVYIAAVPAASATPPDTVQCQLAPGRYAVFTHRGSLSEFPKTIHAIWHEWIPAHQDMCRNAPAFEYYDERFDPASNSGEIDIYVAVN